MESIIKGFEKAFQLIITFNPELLDIIFLSLKVSGIALLIATIVGLPVGTLIALKRFRRKGMLIAILNTLMGLPPVVVGLFLYLVLSRSGPLGFIGILYTPSAMVIAQTILALPIIISLSHSAITSVNPLIRQASISLGATPLQSALAVIKEARYGIMAGIIAGLGRVMSEVGAILIVGGNIAGYTRVMTTAIALETDRGDFGLAIALGIILLIISLCINIVLHKIQKSGDKG